MPELDYSLMNDTLDNFSFADIKLQNLGPKTSKDISFDDSHFVEDILFNFDISHCLNTILKPLEADDSQILVNSSTSSDEPSPLKCSPVIEEKNEARLINSPTLNATSLIKSSHIKIVQPESEQLPAIIPITEQMCYLSSWSIPDPVLQKYKLKNVTKMFHWQCECLSNPRVLHELSNLIYSAPTSAGKTLVAEILALKTIFNRKKKTIFILPFVSIVKEKMYYFQDLLEGTGIRVEGYMGSYNPPGGFAAIQFAICTIEKANSLINRLLEEGSLADVGAVFVDEMHLLGDPHRGYLLELLLSKLRYISLKVESIKIQIIGMSATLPNLGELATWLGAELYSTSFRPIPLVEQVIVNGEIYDKDFQLLRKLEPLADVEVDTDFILQLCLEVIRDSHSVLIFCPTKKWCESLAQQLSQAFFKIGNSQTTLGELLRTQIKSDLIMEVLEQLKLCPTGLDSVLRKTVSFGIGFHHAGLTMDERDIIEGSFRNGAIKVLAATSTLSSGVNLPARRVIIRSPVFCGSSLDLLKYRQMIGRAGRLGQDTEGESILVCQKDDYAIAKQLLTAELPTVNSCLQTSGKLKRAILEVIASGVVSTPSDVALFSSCTLLSLSNGERTALENPVEEALEYLKKYEFISFQKDDGNIGNYRATALGKACLSSSISPDEAITLLTELERARQCFVLETELHLIYLVTPYTACNSWGVIDWIFYLDLWNKLSVAMKRVGELVGVSEFYIVSATRGKGDLNSTNPKVRHKIMVHKRFFVSLVLQDLVNEVPLVDVCLKFNCNRGMLQSLQQSAATFAGMVTAFSRQLGWSSVEILLAQFQDRLQFGVSRDLLDLMRLQSLTSKLARTLYKAGVETLVQLANSEVNSIETILLKSGPFESSHDAEGEGEKKKIRSVWIAGKEGLTQREAAELLVKEARNYLENEMGLKEAKWTVQKIEDESRCAMVNARETQEQLESPTETLEATPQSESRISNCSSISNQNLETGVVNNSSSSLNISDSSLYGTENDSLNKCISGSTFSSSESFSLHLSDDDVSGKPEVQDLNPPMRTATEFRELQALEEKKRARLSFEEGSNENTPTKKSRKVDALNQSLTAAIEKYTQLSLEDDHYSVIAPQLHFRIVDVCKSKALFKNFVEAIASRTDIAFSIAYEKLEKRDPLIGGNICVGFNAEETKLCKSREIQGFLVYWGGTDSSFLSVDSEALEVIAKYLKSERNTVRMFNAKKHIKILIENLKLDLQSGIDDPKVGDWLLDLDGREKNLSSMVNFYYKDLNTQVLALCDYMKNNDNLESDPKMKACTEVILTWHLVDLIRKKGKIHIAAAEQIRYKSFPAIYELEMKTLLIVAQMEINGMSVDRSSLQHLVGLLNDQKSSIERKAYSLAGRKFNFSSSSDVSKVIGTYSGKKSSTKKKLLERSEHPISDLVIQWRKLNYTLTQTINPLLRQCQNNRIYGSYDGHTSTGRISMHEPNIQMVPKDFSVIDPILKKEFTISCRSAFRASKDCVLISADYCQLELRVLTYLSRDEVLLDIMGKPGDIFTSIAAKWNNIAEDMVNDTMRQNVKQICYGIIYGMGAKTLAEQMEISTEDATEFMETFRNKYSGMKEFIMRAVDDCKKSGYAESIAGRKRCLPHINHLDPTLRSQAERKAVNTKVQGSAADIVKTAMMAIDSKIEVVFRKSTQKPKLVLHLHDELIYEVSEKYLEKTVRIIRTSMENSPREFGHFPVKIKTGYSWGHLNEYHQ